MKFSVGINYWPRRSAMQMWQRFDPGEIADDMHRIADLGLDAVRFFLRWSDFQPAPRRMDLTMLERLVRMTELIGAAGLRALPTLFCGHMSGVNWLPSWALDRTSTNGRYRTITEDSDEPYGAADLYDGPMLDAQRYHVREVGTALRDHPNLVAWDLGNAFGNLREPATPSAAREWSKRLTAELERTSGHPVTGSLHADDLISDRHIRPSSIAEPWEFATMHGTAVPSEISRSDTDTDVVPFLGALTASLAQKPVLVSEFGNATSLDEAETAVYARSVLEKLHATGRLGAYWWCWADYGEHWRKTPPFDRAPHERYLGIVRADGSLKPVAEALAAFAREERAVVEPNDPAMFEPAYYAELPRSTHDAFARFLEFHI